MDRVVLGLCVVFGSMTVLSVFALWAAHSKRFGGYRIRSPAVVEPPTGQKYANIAMNSLLSLSFYVVCLYFGSALLIQERPFSVPRLIAEVAASLLLYDFLYYLMHRALHRPLMMRLIHGVHHRIRYPVAFDGLYLNPLENIAGLGLLFFSVAVVGPVSAASFLTVALLHSFINIVTHTNLVIPHPAFRMTNHWAVRHDRHHYRHLNANFATIFPFWDLMFGTYR